MVTPVAMHAAGGSARDAGLRAEARDTAQRDRLQRVEALAESVTAILATLLERSSLVR